MLVLGKQVNLRSICCGGWLSVASVHGLSFCTSCVPCWFVDVLLKHSSEFILNILPCSTTPVRGNFLKLLLRSCGVASSVVNYRNRSWAAVEMDRNIANLLCNGLFFGLYKNLGYITKSMRHLGFVGQVVSM
ncbi:hypothetical protein Acr_24g0006040 [Actinidia rufa]|uniref:Uncharacterized protein n=1 Tax=Actinidia rufa TaxID=165716 RepID=A0A7J0GV59_9ERIC|nr:hypothetical protein Acr_24g0006040 [Actinidia rufa]